MRKMKKTKMTKTKNETNLPICQRLEIWTIAQNWRTMNENVKKKKKENEKDERKMKKAKKSKPKKLN